jgi:hypothetical protein
MPILQHLGASDDIRPQYRAAIQIETDNPCRVHPTYRRCGVSFSSSHNQVKS